MSALLRALSIPGMLGVGALVAIQAQLTGSLAAALGGGFGGGSLAALWSFGSGFVLVSLIVFLSPARRAGVRRMFAGARQRVLPRWFFLGGLLGALLVAAQSFAVPVIGVALMTVAFVAGQTGSALAVDRLGIGPAGVQPLSRSRIVAAVITVLAVVLGVSGRLGTGALTGAGLALVLMAVLAGVGSSFQQGMNGRVAGLGGPWAATWNNFLVGTIVLAVLVGLSRIGAEPLPPPPAVAQNWWLYLAGVLGMVFIWANASLVRIHGVLILSLCVIAGQVSTATVLDVVRPDGYAGPFTIVGAALTVVGVVIALAARNQPIVPRD